MNDHNQRDLHLLYQRLFPPHKIGSFDGRVSGDLLALTHLAVLDDLEGVTPFLYFFFVIFHLNFIQSRDFVI